MFCRYFVFVALVFGAVGAAAPRKVNCWPAETVAVAATGLNRANRATELPSRLFNMGSLLMNFGSLPPQLRDLYFPGFELDLGLQSLFELGSILGSGIGYNPSVSPIPFDREFFPDGNPNQSVHERVFSYALAFHVTLFLFSEPTLQELVDLFWAVETYGNVDFTDVLNRQIVAYIHSQLASETNAPLTAEVLGAYLDRKEGVTWTTDPTAASTLALGYRKHFVDTLTAQLGSISQNAFAKPSDPNSLGQKIPGECLEPLYNSLLAAVIVPGMTKKGAFPNGSPAGSHLRTGEIQGRLSRLISR